MIIKAIACRMMIAYNISAMEAYEVHSTFGRIETAAFGNGWRGVMVVSEGTKELMEGVESVEEFFEDFDEEIKKEGDNLVAVKRITAGGREVKVVVKRYFRGRGFREFFRSFRSGRGLRNFKRAVELCEKSIAAVRPVAALEQRKGVVCRQSIFLCEYIDGGSDLYDFVKRDLGGLTLNERRDLCREVGEFLANLHRSGFWHRDAKASNFMVVRDGESKGLKLVAIDLDGIKRYVIPCKSKQFRCLWQMAASLMPRTLRPASSPTWRRKCSASIGMSEIRSRNGGSSTLMTLIR